MAIFGWIDIKEAEIYAGAATESVSTSTR